MYVCMYVNVALDFLWCSPPAGSFPIACPRLFGPAFHPDAGRAVGAHGRLGRGAAEAVCGRGLRHLDAWWSQGYEHVPTCKHGGKQQGLASNMFYVHMTTFGIFGDDGWSSLMNTCSHIVCVYLRDFIQKYMAFLQVKPLEALIIDFQWTGVGYGVADVAMHLPHSVHDAALRDGGEEKLVKMYYNDLIRQEFVL